MVVDEREGEEVRRLASQFQNQIIIYIHCWTA